MAHLNNLARRGVFYSRFVPLLNEKSTGRKIYFLSPCVKGRGVKANRSYFTKREKFLLLQFANTTFLYSGASRRKKIMYIFAKKTEGETSKVERSGRLTPGYEGVKTSRCIYYAETQFRNS